MNTPLPPDPGEFPLHDEIDGAFDEFGNPIGDEDETGFGDEPIDDFDPGLDDEFSPKPAGFGGPARQFGGPRSPRPDFGGPRSPRPDFGGPRSPRPDFGRSGFESRQSSAKRADALVERLLKRF